MTPTQTDRRMDFDTRTQSELDEVEHRAVKEFYAELELTTMDEQEHDRTYDDLIDELEKQLNEAIKLKAGV